jgi:RecA/RadA recombinase
MYALKHPEHPFPFMENIYVENVSSLEGMEGILFNRLPLRIEEDAVRVVVIDSIASVVRHEFVEPQSYRERAERLVAIAQHLKRLVDRHDLIVVVMNQISDIISASDDSIGMKKSHGSAELDFRSHPSLSMPMEGNFPISWIRSDGKRTTASLGYVWAHCVTTRIALERTDLMEMEGSSVRRYARILLSPHLPMIATTEFEIYEGGLRGKDRRCIG